MRWFAAAKGRARHTHNTHARTHAHTHTAPRALLARTRWAPPHCAPSSPTFKHGVHCGQLTQSLHPPFGVLSTQAAALGTPAQRAEEPSMAAEDFSFYAQVSAGGV